MSEPIGNRRTFGRLPGGGYVFTLIDEPLTVEVRHLRRERQLLHAEVDVRCPWVGVVTHKGSLSCADLNLSSQTARKTLANYCAERAHTKKDEFDWMGVIDATCLLVLQAEKDGLPPIVLDDAPPEGPPRDFMVHGLSIPADSHSQVVTDGGGLKSLILLLVLGEMARTGRPVVYLDWEWNAARHLARKRRLFSQAGRLETLFYLRCHNPLTVEKDHIRRFCEQHAIQFIGLDSIGAACEGKLADDDVARAYNKALDDLPPSLAAAHVPKTGTDPNADLKAFGSAFFHNYARMTWSLRKQVGASEDVVTVMLAPHKQNDGARLRPVGLEFMFSPERIDVRGVDLADVEGFAEKLPLATRMMHLLKTRPLTFVQIAEELDAKVDSVMKAAARSSAFTKVLSQDGITRIALVARQADR